MTPAENLLATITLIDDALGDWGSLSIAPAGEVCDRLLDMRLHVDAARRTLLADALAEV